MNLSQAYAAARDLLKPLYVDSADVARSAKEGNVVGWHTVHTGIACHLSPDSIPVLNQGEQIATAPSDYTVFCLPDEDIREGDRLTITHLGETAEYDVGTVHLYEINRVCKCKRRGIV